MRAGRIGLSDGRSGRSIRTTPGAFSSSQATSSELKPSPFVAPAATTRSKRSCSISRRNACRTLRPGSILESTGTPWVAARCWIARGTERSDRGQTGWPRSTQKRRGGTGRRQHLGASKQLRRCGPRDSPRHCCSDEPTASKAAAVADLRDALQQIMEATPRIRPTTFSAADPFTRLVAEDGRRRRLGGWRAAIHSRRKRW